MSRVLTIEHKKGGMECVMNFPHFGELELVSDQGEDLDNGEGSFSFGCELQVGDRMF